MRTTITTGIILLASLMSVSGNAQQESQWETIDNPKDLRDLISDRSMEFGVGAYYLRADGKMIYSNRVYDSMVFREWTIEDDGEICQTVYGHPDNVVECIYLQQSSSDPGLYRIGDAGQGAYQFRFADPSQKLVDTLSAKADVN